MPNEPRTLIPRATGLNLVIFRSTATSMPSGALSENCAEHSWHGSRAGSLSTRPISTEAVSPASSKPSR